MVVVVGIISGIGIGFLWCCLVKCILENSYYMLGIPFLFFSFFWIKSWNWWEATN